MAWQQWLYLILAVGGSIYAVAKIGTPRGDYTPANVAATLFLQSLLVWLVLPI